MHPLDQRVATNRRGCRSTVGIVPVELSAAEIDAAEIIANKVRTVETLVRVEIAAVRVGMAVEVFVEQVGLVGSPGVESIDTRV